MAPSPTLHRAAPLAELLREEAQSEEAPSQAARELLLEEHDISASDTQDFYPARTAPPNGTWDVPLDGEALEKEEQVVFRMLDEFDAAPPSTMQRLAELVLKPTQHYRTRAKYLAALERVLAVSSSLNSYEGEEEEEESAFPFRGAAEAEAEPIFSPIPFLHQGSENTEAAQRAETAAQRPVPADDQAVYRVPDGRVDELDTADAQESHGGVADEVQPMSAATSLPEEKESLAKRQRSSDV